VLAISVKYKKNYYKIHSQLFFSVNVAEVNLMSSSNHNFPSDNGENILDK
jgi:hypothetical protein